MRLPKASFMESLGHKWVYWMILLPAVLARISIGLRADSGTSPEVQFLDSSWRWVIPGVWYTATPLSHNPPCKEETQNYQSVHKPAEPQVLRPLAFAFLLCYSGADFFLGQFNLLLGQYHLFLRSISPWYGVLARRFIGNWTKSFCYHSPPWKITFKWVVPGSYLLLIQKMKSHPRDSNPNPLQAASPQALLPAFFWVQVKGRFEFGETSKTNL
ncbi:hypothetical protein DSO57_1032310 [Entomophthora muscae]|uniref:Uncharacterized protein n=1 Tax=Entomophthora muscae TaxID=34485 RepID=A0ACC2TNF6_9FUNG|nr:hypothetical protein DSO57_1032310 [Entomophthora muscae]